MSTDQSITPVAAGTFETRVPGWIEINNNDESVLFSTAQFGDSFGEITKMELSRNADTIELKGGWQQVKACILTNFSYALNLEINMKAGVTPPGPGDQITFPLAGVKGIVQPGVKLGVATNGVQTLSLQATSFDSLSHEGMGVRKVVSTPNPTA